ncbi:MAG TPA: hypothetical protein VFX16_29365 [Pseudonocardiaceae bacterium]|nr:hypothetical protein [Pseudonocardiaceae bacterium]
MATPSSRCGSTQRPPRDGLGIPHSPVIEASIGWLLVFDDPDGLQLHLYSWTSHGIDRTGKFGYGQPVRTS